MPAITPPVCEFGLPAPDFTLPATDGKTYSLADIAGEKGTMIVFICNHCPYVLRVLDKIVADMKALQDLGIGVAAICANDAVNYPADSFENMQKLAQDSGFTFPYLHDETQSVARAYAAECTPDFFGYNAEHSLQYRGRLDDGKPGGVRELVEAMRQIAETGAGPQAQTPSMGCSIKWV